MPRATGLSAKMSEWAYLDGALYRAKKIEDQEEVEKVCKEMKEFQKEYDWHMDRLYDGRFNIKHYTAKHYILDCTNYLDYFSTWEKEDVYETKASLRRAKLYEKHTGVEHFLDRHKKHTEKMKLEKASGMRYAS